MKKLYFLAFLLIPFLGHAEKVLTQFVDEDGTSTISYDADGRVSKVVTTSSDDPYWNSFEADWSKYGSGVVTVTFCAEYTDGLNFEIRTDNSGRATEVWHPLLSTPVYRLSYDSENQLTGVSEDLGDETSNMNVSWENGNIMKITGTEKYDNKTDNYTVEMFYTDANHATPIPNKGEFVGAGYTFGLEIDRAGLINVLQLFKLTGKQVKDLPLKAVLYTEGEAPYVCTVEYKLDADGYPIEGHEKQNGEDDYTYFTWGEATGGIADINTENRTISGYYNLNGIRLEAPAQGINIVRYSDGSCEKMIMR